MRASIFLQGLLSFLIVAFGIPSFAPALGPVAAFLGYALFWRAIRLYPFASQRFWRAGLWYGAISLIQLSWMTSIEYQGFYILVVWVGLSIWLGAQFGLVSLLIPYNKPVSLPRIFAITAAWTLIEWGRYYFICGYSWNGAGIAFCNTKAIYFSTLFGFLGLSFWVMFVNLVGLRAFLKKGIPHYLIWFGLAAVPYIYGLGHLGYHETRARKSPTYCCLLVQTGLLPPEKIPIQGKIRHFIPPSQQWKRILELVKVHSDQNVDLIVLPEAAVPCSSLAKVYDKATVHTHFRTLFPRISAEHFPPSAEGRVSNQYWAQTLANLTGSEVVIGLDHAEQKGKSYNSAFHFIPNGETAARYDKRILMPLAEYLPFAVLAPLVKSYGIADFFTHGKSVTLFYGKVPLSASICYEETFPHKIREGRKQGAKLLVNITNDGWYPNSRLPQQHMENAKFRAIENGVPLVRACNTGITALIDSFGRPIKKLGQSEKKGTLLKGAIFGHVPLYEYTTPYLLWGNTGILIVCSVLLAIFLVFRRSFKW